MVYTFGEYELDADRYQLRWRGDELELEPKVFEVLAYLLEQRDRVVPKMELLEKLWPDQIVGEWSLTRCISVARKALQDSPSEQRVIRTLYGRGYRFVADAQAGERATAPSGGSSADADSPPLVGRDRALGELRGGLDSIERSRGRVFLITGETGIGKTRLVDELAALAEERGATVRVGHCWETEGAPAYWPWLQILRADARARGVDELRALMGSDAGEILRLIPELRDEIGDVAPAAPLEPRQARFRLFDAVSRLVKRSAGEGPLVLVLEDLHRADGPSLRLFEFLARDISGASILLIGTYRDEDLGRDSSRGRIIGELSRASSAQYLPLEGLTPNEVARFVEQATGEPPEEAVTRALHQQTAGNPFFLHQVVPALASDGLLVGVDPNQPLDLALPRGVRQAILRQLDGLSEAARELLEVAAVQGQRYSLGVLEQATGLESSDLLEALGELQRRGIAIEHPERPGRFRFAHALIRDTLYAELTPSRRAAAHRGLGEALEAVHGEEQSPHYAELAHHFSEARSVGGAKKALDYAIGAGRWARDRLAYEEASRYFERAIDLLELQDESDEPLRCDLLLELGEAQLRATDVSAARSSLQRAAELARGLNEPERLARAACAIGQTQGPFVKGAVDPQVVTMLEAALARLPRHDSALRARTLASLVLAEYWDYERIERSTQLCEEALAMARRVGDSNTLLFVLSAVISSRWGPDFVEERAELAGEAIRLGESAGVKEEVLDARVLRLTAWFELVKMDAVDAELAEISRLTSELHQTEADEYLPWFKSARAIMVGDFDQGEELAGEFLDHAQRRGDQTGLLSFALQFTLLRWIQGRGDEIHDVVVDLCERHPAVPTFRAMLARVLCDLGRFGEARREVERIWPEGGPGLPKKLGWTTTMALLAETVVLLGDQNRAAALYREIAPYSRRHFTAGGAAYLGSVPRFLGMLAGELGHWDMAERHFDLALDMEGRMGARPSQVWTRYHYARMLRRRGDQENRAHELTEAALAGSRELGLSSLSERIAAS
jgi:DNA-binding winged helix-turn-helix (wHTH) protein/tetratricopeptide (TPR) repeat protein